MTLSVDAGSLSVDAMSPSVDAMSPSVDGGAALGAGLEPTPGATPTEQLAGRVRRLRTSAAAGRFDRGLLLVGGILLPLGILLVVLGWMGASHTVLLFEQIPYLVSGGLLGLALVFAGGFVYFAYWQTLLVRETRAHSRDLAASLGRIEALLAEARVAAPPRQAAGRAAAGPMLVATATGTMMHRPDCPVVTGRDNLREVAAGAAGLEACKICQPLASA